MNDDPNSTHASREVEHQGGSEIHPSGPRSFNAGHAAGAVAGVAAGTTGAGHVAEQHYQHQYQPQQFQTQPQPHQPQHQKLDHHKLKAVSSRLGPRIIALAHEYSSTVQPTQEWVRSVLSRVPTAVLDAESFGAEIYINTGNASVKQAEEIRPGDVVVCEDATFQGSKSPLQKYHKTYTNNAFIVDDWDGTKRKLRLIDHKKENLKLNDLRKGIIRVYRVLDLEYFN